MAFHDVMFPLQAGFDAVGGPQFSTLVASLASGFEQRNMQWANGRLSYDVGPGVRSEADLAELVAFFRARRGQAFAFRFRDPLDWSSAALGTEISAHDQLLGRGDGKRVRFPLVKRYGDDDMGEERGITRPDPATVRVSIGGEESSEGWVLEDRGMVRFDVAPAEGVEVRAGFAFDVPVRFAVDRLDISLSGWNCGEVPNVPVVEVRE